VGRGKEDKEMLPGLHRITLARWLRCRGKSVIGSAVHFQIRVSLLFTSCQVQLGSA